MSFIVGAILFAALIGALDAKLPWPSTREDRSGR